MKEKGDSVAQNDKVNWKRAYTTQRTTSKAARAVESRKAPLERMNKLKEEIEQATTATNLQNAKAIMQKHQKLNMVRWLNLSKT